MENKTCINCRFLGIAKKIGFCEKQAHPVCPSKLTACSKFEQKIITNGDIVRQMSNEKLAEIINNVNCKKCPAYMTCFDGKKKTCFDGFLAWLNAPADCVKQNENHDTQADLCKADNTESEGCNG